MGKNERKFRGRNGGFTLVELIVILVILALLAALLVPSLTGYIDRARNQSIVTETRMAVMAAQTVTSQNYGKTNSFVAVSDYEVLASYMSDTAAGNLVDGFDAGCITDYTADANGKVISMVYTKGSKKCTYTAGADDPYKVTAA